eukprot:249415-Chlamydomonas_euryale.AAC.2
MPVRWGAWLYGQVVVGVLWLLYRAMSSRPRRGARSMSGGGGGGGGGGADGPRSAAAARVGDGVRASSGMRAI